MTALAGFGPLLRLALRRDRVKLAVWLLAVVGMSAYCGTAVRTVYADPADLKAVVGFVTGPAGIVMSGPGYGLAEPTHGAAFAGVYGVWVLLVSGIASILLVGRHSRAEEEAGRLELVRAGRVGRAAPLAVAAVIAVAFDALVLLASWGVLVAVGFTSGDSALFAAGVALVGLVFAAVTGVTAQLAEHSRTATSTAGLLLSGAMVVRAAGDILGDAEGRHGSWLSWLSPLAWAQQTRAYVDGRWWPLLLAAGLAVLLAVAAYALARRRDLGAGLVPARLGHARAPRWMGSPLGLALRVERGALLGWSTALLLAGALYGSLVASVESSVGQLDSGLLVEVMGGGTGAAVDGYLGVCVLTAVLMVTGYAVAAAHRAVGEETTGRLGLVLSAAVARPVWLGSLLVVAVLGSVVTLAAGGLGMGLGAWSVTGEAAYVGTCLAAHLVYLPAVWVVLAVAAVGFSLRPGWLAVAWVVLAYAAVVGVLGPALDLPEAVLDVSPFHHVGMPPLDDPTVGPLVVLAALAVLLAGLALVRFRRRDLATG